MPHSVSAPPMRLKSDLFVPSNGSLVIRDNLADGIDIPTETYRKSGHLRRPATTGGYRFGKLSLSSFFTRHNPHPKRVNHFKGLLDVPICSVNDFGYTGHDTSKVDFPPNGYQNEVLSSLPTGAINVNTQKYPMDTLTGLHYFHPFKDKSFARRPVTGIMAVTEQWRTELQQIAQAAGLTPRDEDKPKEVSKRPMYSAETGRLIPPPSRAASRGHSRLASRLLTRPSQLDQLTQLGPGIEEPLVENTVMAMLCQILQTEDVASVQTWLCDAGDREKNMVEELIRAAMAGTTGDYERQYPVQEYLVNSENVPKTPLDLYLNSNTTIGANVQNRLCTADDNPELSAPDHDLNQLSDTLPPLNQSDQLPEIRTRTVLPPIAESYGEINELAEVPAVRNELRSRMEDALKNITRSVVDESFLSRKNSILPISPKNGENPDQQLRLSTDDVFKPNCRLSEDKKSTSESRRESVKLRMSSSSHGSRPPKMKQSTWKPDLSTVV